MVGMVGGVGELENTLCLSDSLKCHLQRRIPRGNIPSVSPITPQGHVKRIPLLKHGLHSKNGGGGGQILLHDFVLSLNKSEPHKTI